MAAAAGVFPAIRRRSAGASLGRAGRKTLAGRVPAAELVVAARRVGGLVDRPPINRSGRAGIAAVAVVSAFLVRVVVIPSETSGFDWWLDAHLGSLLLSVVCLAVASLRLDAAQRVTGIAAATTFGSWILAWTLSLWPTEDDEAARRFVVVSLLTVVVSVAACWVAQAGPRPEPGTVVRQPALPTGEHRSPAGPPAGTSVPLLLSLILGGGVLLLLSRFVVFESTNGYRADEAGLDTLPWVLCVGLPVLAAGQLLIARGSTGWAVALAGGLVTGAALGLLDQTLAYSAYIFSPDVSESPGPGWWLSLFGTAVLLAGVSVVIRQPPFRARPALRSDWRAVVAALLVIGGLVAWLTAFRESSFWFVSNEPALMLAAVCLPVAVLALNGAQRLLGLVTVTIVATWVAASHVEALTTQMVAIDAGAAVVALAAVACSLAGCYLAQAPPARSATISKVEARVADADRG